jgi:hypothetical protein
LRLVRSVTKTMLLIINESSDAMAHPKQT